MDVFDARISVPFGMILAGPPMSGKSTFAVELLHNAGRLFTKSFKYVVWFYGEYNHTVELLENTFGDKVKTVQGLPETLDDFIEEGVCLIFDDLMQQVVKNKQLSELTSRKCQHSSVSWILILQNIFVHGSERLTLMRCAHYLVLYKNPLDKTVAQFLAARIMPKNQKLFMKIYEKATSKPNGYLFIDGTQHTPDKARLRTNIFNTVQTVFVPH